MALSKKLRYTSSMRKAKQDTIAVQISNTCRSELVHERSILASDYWSDALNSYCVTGENHDLNNEVMVLDDDMCQTLDQFIVVPKQLVQNAKCKTSTMRYTPLPLEDVTQIQRQSDLSQVKRIATKFPLFMDLQDEDVVLVPLHDGQVMKVSNDNIRYVESFLVCTQQDDVDQQDYNKKRDLAPIIYYSNTSAIPRLSAFERAIVLYLVSYDRCSNEELIAYLNMHLQQLTAFTFELIRRGGNMHAVVAWFINEYMNTTTRKHIKSVVDKIEERNTVIGESVRRNWVQQRIWFKSKEQQLLDMCVDEDAIVKRTNADEITQFYHKIMKEINAVKNALIELYIEKENYKTLCAPVHLLQLKDTAYTMSTPVLRMAIQRRVDFLSLLIMEHNMRAQENKLVVQHNFYDLAMENTILSYELMQVNLHYEPQSYKPRMVCTIARTK